jgi:hypothetical protein
LALAPPSHKSANLLPVLKALKSRKVKDRHPSHPRTLMESLAQVMPPWLAYTLAAWIAAACIHLMFRPQP